VFVPRFEFRVCEFDQARPWIVVRDWTETREFEDEEELEDWVREHWPEPRYGLASIRREGARLRGGGRADTSA
jgi:hypothetical protein